MLTVMAAAQGDDQNDPLLIRVRQICLALPGAAEKASHGRPMFFTTKGFATYGAHLRGDHHSTALSRAVVILPDADERPALLEDPRFTVPAYSGPAGWLALDLTAGRPNWSEVAELVDMSYRNTAPARLVAELDAGRG